MISNRGTRPPCGFSALAESPYSSHLSLMMRRASRVTGSDPKHRRYANPSEKVAASESPHPFARAKRSASSHDVKSDPQARSSTAIANSHSLPSLSFTNSFRPSSLTSWSKSSTWPQNSRASWIIISSQSIMLSTFSRHYRACESAGAFFSRAASSS